MAEERIERSARLSQPFWGKGSGKAHAFHKPLGHREICAKHSANGKPNALPWVRAQDAHGKTVCTQPFSKQRLYQIRSLLGCASRCTTTACGSAGRLAPPYGGRVRGTSVIAISEVPCIRRGITVRNWFGEITTFPRSKACRLCRDRNAA